MVKIIGKRLSVIVGRILVHVIAASFCAFFGSILHAQSNVILKAFDMEGNSIKQAGAGQPFVIEVDVQGLGNVMQKPTIDAPDSITLRSTGYHMTSINGAVTLKHKYRAVAQQPGAYAIGPATIEKDGKEYRSNAITVEVGQQALSATPINTGKNSAIAFLELTVDKNHVVVGEPLECVLRFYYTDQVLQVAPINKPELNVFKNDAEQGPFKGTKEIKGKKYSYLEWRWNTKANRVGSQVIACHSADFTAQADDDFSRQFGMFARQLGEQKRVYSNAVTITVDPLPPHASPVHAIGVFSRACAQLKPTAAKVGEGMVYTLEVEGDGAIDASQSSQLLQSLPPEFKYYDSRQYVAEKKHENSQTKHCFEFIVQALQPGSFTIPKQQFTFFDTASRRYKTLDVAPIDVEISPSAVRASSHNAINHESKESEHEVDDIRGVRSYTSSFSMFSYAIPWWLFFLFVLAPVFIFYTSIIRFVVAWYANRISPERKKKRAFARARAAIKQAKPSNVSQIYNAFKTLFAVQCGLPFEQVTHEVIEQELRNKQISLVDLTQWNDFYTVLAEQVFFGKQKDHDGHFVQQALTWVEKFQVLMKEQGVKHD